MKIGDNNFESSELPNPLAIFPLHGVLLLPGARLPLNIFERRYLEMVSDAMAGNRFIAMIQPRDPQADLSHPPIYDIGCAGYISEFRETNDGRFLIQLDGVSRFRITNELATATRYRQVLVDWSPYESDLADEQAPINRQHLTEGLGLYLEHFGIEADWDAIRKAPSDRLANFLAMTLPFAPAEKQALLESENVQSRCELLAMLMQMAARAPAEDDSNNDPGGRLN